MNLSKELAHSLPVSQQRNSVFIQIQPFTIFLYIVCFSYSNNFMILGARRMCVLTAENVLRFPVLRGKK